MGKVVEAKRRGQLCERPRVSSSPAPVLLRERHNAFLYPGLRVGLCDPLRQTTCSWVRRDRFCGVTDWPSCAPAVKMLEPGRPAAAEGAWGTCGAEANGPRGFGSGSAGSRCVSELRRGRQGRLAEP